MSARDTVRIQMIVDTGFAGARHEDEIEVDRDEWDGMTEREREDYMQESLRDMENNHIESWWKVIE